MAKDLPYFKWIPSEWNDGNISLCTYGAKGLFADICSLYWSREGELTEDFMRRKLKAPDDLVKELLRDEIFSINDDKKVVIKFLDEQLIEAGLRSENARKAAGIRHGKPTSNAPKDATAMQPHTDRKNGSNATSSATTMPLREDKRRKDNTTLSKKESSISTSAGVKTPRPTAPPLWASLGPGSIAPVKRIEAYAKRLEELEVEHEKSAEVFRFFLPIEISGERSEDITRFFAGAKPGDADTAMMALVDLLTIVAEDLHEGQDSAEVAKFFDRELLGILTPPKP